MGTEGIGTGQYAPIGTYALVSDGHGCCLIGIDGSIDWLAVPAIDSPPLLAAVLDAHQGGRFVVQPTEEFRSRRRYVEDTMVLETDFETRSGTLRVTDSMNLGRGGPLPWSELARTIEVLNGSVQFRWELRPGNRLASVVPWVHLRHGRPFVLSGDLLSAVAAEGAGEPEVEQGAVCGTSTLTKGQSAIVVLVTARDAPLMVPAVHEVRARVQHTMRFWRDWAGQIAYDGPYGEHLRRSVLTLKGLSDARTGALVAAPTTSLPEALGEKRNYDYRYGWVRDASFMMNAFASVGLTEELDASVRWLLAAVSRTAPEVHVMYRLDGEPAPAQQEEVELLEGYRGTRPVQEGNKAASQRQIGAYGDLFGAVLRHVERGARIDTGTAVMLSQLADRVCDEWPLPDAGIWELGDYRNYTSSLISSWAALHGATELVERGDLPDIHAERWKEAMDTVHAWVDGHCWSESKQAYSFYAGTDDVDASVLLAARTGFLAGDDPRLWSTIDAVRRDLTAEGPWLYRYTGAADVENAFVCCTFWLIEALSHAGRTQEARELIDGALKGSNDVLLWSEEKNPYTGELMGNFPLGLSHLALVGALSAFSAALGG